MSFQNTNNVSWALELGRIPYRYLNSLGIVGSPQRELVRVVLADPEVFGQKHERHLTCLDLRIKGHTKVKAKMAKKSFSTRTSHTFAIF